MALRRSQTSQRPARALTAAAIRLDPKDPKKARRETKKRPLPWQKTAFDYYDDLGEAHFAASWVGEACSRITLVPAYADVPGEPATNIDSEEQASDANASPEEYRAVQAALARIGASEGGEREILRSSAVNLFVAGEYYLIARVDDEINAERWEVVSVDALTTTQKGEYAIRPTPDCKPDERIVLEDQAFIMRTMRRHPRFPDWPDSAMRGALDYCEDLRLLTAAIRAAATSRIPAGIVGIPENMDFVGPADDRDADDEDKKSDILDTLMTHMSTPLSDPKSAASLVPILIRGSKADLEGIVEIGLHREIDSLAVQLREETRRSFATSVDLPAEILVGLSTANHWTAWAITDEAYRIHIEPYAAAIADAMTHGYLRAAIAENVADPSLWSIGTNPSQLVSSPDESKDVQDAYDRVEVSGAYYRQVRGIPEDAKPDDEELERRKTLADVITAGKAAPAAPFGGGNGGAPPAQPGEVEPGPPENEITAAAIPDAELVDEPLALNVGDDVLAGVGERLARSEIMLRDRVRFVADEALRRALERAGNRLRSLANKDRSGLARRVAEDVPAHLVASTLGPAIVAGLSTDVDDLLQGAWDNLEERWDDIVGNAQREARRYVVGLAVRTGEMAEGSLDALAAAGILDSGAFEKIARQHRAEGFATLHGGLSSIAATKLFSPTAQVPQAGEFDSTSLVPPRLVRGALMAAGGGAAVDFATGMEMGGGVFTGAMLQEMLADSAKAVFGTGTLEWVYGDPGSRTRPFDGHEQLDGATFTKRDDEVLEVLPGDEWLGTHYWIDDHDGCQCEIARQVRRGTETQLAAAFRSRARREMGERTASVLRRNVDALDMHGVAEWASEREISQGGALYEALSKAAGLSDREIAVLVRDMDELMRRYPQLAETLTNFKYGGQRSSTATTAWGIDEDGAQRVTLGLSDIKALWKETAASNERGWFVAHNPEGIVVHELGHVSHDALMLHMRGDPYKARESILDAIGDATDAVWGSSGFDDAARLLPDVEAAIARDVSAYAAEGPFERFAEVFALRNAPAGSVDTLTPEARANVDAFAAKMNEWAAQQGYPEKIL